MNIKTIIYNLLSDEYKEMIKMHKDKKLIKEEIESLNEEIKKLGHRLSELLHVNCSFGQCILDPEVIMIQNRIKEAQEMMALLERVRKNKGSSLNK